MIRILFPPPNGFYQHYTRLLKHGESRILLPTKLAMVLIVLVVRPISKTL
jgi:hypothetical protein